MRNCAFCPAICRKAGEPPGAIFAVLYRSRRHRMATRHRTDFNISYESSMNSNGFSLCDDRACISQRAHTAPKSAFWCSKNSGFVVFTMSPGMHRCCHRRPRIIHRRGRNCTRTQEITTFAISHVPANHCNVMPQKRKCCSRLGTGGNPTRG